uniref:Uncharacterized protein n=1 Tax=Thermosporothrix sp. COM3 TaxID=2490863 RepID=A0A455SN26_9CHLR|nr:hypothetical protein KTC_45940 [Thermosporothrix sp. COM3]
MLPCVGPFIKEKKWREESVLSFWHGEPPALVSVPGPFLYNTVASGQWRQQAQVRWPHYVYDTLLFQNHSEPRSITGNPAVEAAWERF